MKTKTSVSVIPIEKIQSHIYLIRGHKVMLSMHLAELYGVKPKALIQALKRNSERFPPDFMFQLAWEETRALRSQFVTLEKEDLGRGRHFKYLPYAFTQEGVAMLSSVLRSPRAILVNIAIMRAFVKLREFALDYKQLAEKLGELEVKVSKHDREIQAIFEVIRQLTAPPTRAIGFRVG